MRGRFFTMEISNFESGIEQNQNNKDSEIKPTKRRYWKFIAGFLGIMVIAGAGFFVWNKYFSPQAKLERQTQENYQKYLNWQTNYEKAMKEDTYGGKTPEETLKMFIEALKKEDIGLASKYFVLETDTESPDYLTRKKWENYLQEISNKNLLQQMANDIEKDVKPLTKALNNKEFSYALFNEDGTVGISIDLKFNEYSGVWKIESL